MYAEGQGLPKDEKLAGDWFGKAAKQNNCGGETEFGLLYLEGHDVSRDYKEATRLLTKAAEHGCAKAQFNLGLMFENGRGVQKDENQAAVWYQKAVASHEEASWSVRADCIRLGPPFLLALIKTDRPSEFGAAKVNLADRSAP
jgi:TPR repeat protein